MCLYSIRVKCDIVKPRKPAMDTRQLPAKAQQPIRPDRVEPKFSPVKLGLFMLFFLCLYPTTFLFISFSTS
jgi:hypothetical protein